MKIKLTLNERNSLTEHITQNRSNKLYQSTKMMTRKTNIMIRKTRWRSERFVRIIRPIRLELYRKSIGIIKTRKITSKII